MAGSGISFPTGVFCARWRWSCRWLLSGTGRRPIFWGQIEGYYNPEADIPAHIEDTGLNARRDDGVVEILQPAHVRLVVDVSEVGPFEVDFENVSPGCIDELHTNACAEQVVTGGVGLGAIGGEEAVLRIVVIEPDEYVAVPDTAESFGGCPPQFGMGMRGRHKG